jgi:Neuraminidase (sialidase)
MNGESSMRHEPAQVPAAPVTRVTVQVSYDGGKTWQSATVTGSGGHYRAVYSAPADSYVMLRTAAADSASGRITETITRAYRTGS